MEGSASYSEVPNHLANYDPAKLKILRHGTSPRSIVDFLPVEAAALLKDFRNSIVDQDSMAEVGGFSPYWDPTLRFNKTARVDFVVRLFRAGLLTLRPVAKSHVGVFFVRKKTPDWVRMVIDCRGTNELHRPPPTTRLGSARCYSDLDLSQLPDGSSGWGMEADVTDCFYRFGLEELAHYFAINHPLSAEGWEQLGIGAAEVFDPDVGRMVRTSAQQLLYPCFRVVPMGWSWALFFAQEAVLRISGNNSPWNDGILREKKVTPQLMDHRTLLGVYVDNITILGADRDDVSMRAQALQSSFDQAGIPIEWSQQQPTQQLESVGCILDFKAGVISNKPRRVWKFVRATAALLRRHKLRGEALQVWCGHYTSLCSLTPWGLSALQHVYRFIPRALGKRIRVWSSVRSEMKTAASLVWMCWRKLSAPVITSVEVGDSSTAVYAMMMTQAPADMISQCMRVHERWRFLPMPDELRQSVEHGEDAIAEALSCVVRQQSSQDPLGAVKDFRVAGLTTGYAKMIADAFREGSFLATSAIRSQARAVGKKRIDLDIPALVQPVDPYFCNPDHFKLLWARRWKNVNEHISLKEGRVVLSSLKRSCRVAALAEHRKLSLSDNLPAVCAFSKGRSSNHKMNFLCQTAGAYQFATGILWHVRHVETHRNVSDAPSRLFSSSSPGKKSSKPNRGAANRHGSATFACQAECSRGLSSEPSAPSKPLRPYRRRGDLEREAAHGSFFLEIFSGTGRLTKAMKAAGVPTLEPLDIANGAHCDLRRRSTQQFILQSIKRGIVGFIHLGPPCTIWSQARHGVKESAATRAKEETGLELALFSCAVIRLCQQLGIPFVLENPQSSKLFTFEPLVTALHTGFCTHVDFDMCQYGEPQRKRTCLATSCDFLEPLAKRCNHREHAVMLKGQTKVVDQEGRPRYVNRTALAGAYPTVFLSTVCSFDPASPT